VIFLALHLARYMQTHQVTAIWTSRLEVVLRDTTYACVSQKVNCKIFSLKAHAVVFEGERHLAAHCWWYHTAHPTTTAVIRGIRYVISYTVGKQAKYTETRSALWKSLWVSFRHTGSIGRGTVCASMIKKKRSVSQANEGNWRRSFNLLALWRRNYVFNFSTLCI